MGQEQKVTLMRYVRTDKGCWTRRRVPTGGARGWEQRLDHNPAAFGLDVSDLGEYQIRWYENSKPRYESGADTYAQARTVLAERRDKLNFVDAAARFGVELPVTGESQLLADRLEPFLKKRIAAKKISPGETPRIYRTALDEFLEVTKVRYVEQVNGETLAEFLTKLQERGLSDQTQLNKYAAVGAFLRDCNEGLARLIREYTPKVRKKKPVSYNGEEVNALLVYLYNRPSEYGIGLAAETYLKTGLRDRELSTLTWDMVDLKHGLMTIKDDRQIHLNIMGKERHENIRTKTRRDREFRLPIEPSLLGKLRQWRQDHLAFRFLFPTAKGNPDHHILLRVKIAAHRAGLSCGQCSHCLNPCGECKHCKCGQCHRCRTDRRCIHPHHGEKPCTRIQCEKWKLHRLRHTFATNAVRSGKVDLPMLMNLLGQSKLSTTQVYISAARESEAQAAVNAMFAG
jgi:integrase